MSFAPKINSSLLIEEVKKRSCLYDYKGSHGNPELKNAAWGEIGLALFNEKWHDFSPADKDSLVKDMQVKWKSLRDNFARQIRLQENMKPGSVPGKKYIYMDQLSFLGPYVHRRESRSLLSEDSKDSNDSSNEDSKPLAAIALSSDPMEVSTSQTQFHFVPIQPKSYAPATLTRIDLNNLNQSNFDSQEPPLKKVARCLDELVNMQKDDKLDDPLGNKKFLLSLLPFMKKLPDDVNLEVRLQLMSVLETYTHGKN
ncbi:hypothetical protein ABEB36_003305 [Hypothenemus hampei]